MTAGGKVLPESRHFRHGAALTVACHFGEWLQGRWGGTGPLALITLMPDDLCVTARHRPARSLVCHAVGHGALPARSLVALHRSLHLPMRGRTETRLPFAPGLGTGMSTASLIAHARLAGYAGPPLALARATIAAEGASDPLMFDKPDQIIWASRQGRVLASAPPPFRAHLLGGFFGPAQPTRAQDQDYDDISDLLIAWPRARQLAEAAALASESATRCQKRRGAADDPMPQLVRDLGALGWASSHSGAARALIFPVGGIPARAPQLLREAGLYGIRPLATGTRDLHSR